MRAPCSGASAVENIDSSVPRVRYGAERFSVVSPSFTCDQGYLSLCSQPTVGVAVSHDDQDTVGRETVGVRMAVVV